MVTRLLRMPMANIAITAMMPGMTQPVVDMLSSLSGFVPGASEPKVAIRVASD
jgi:hypothetical protein